MAHRDEENRFNRRRRLDAKLQDVREELHAVRSRILEIRSEIATAAGEGRFDDIKALSDSASLLQTREEGLMKQELLLSEKVASFDLEVDLPPTPSKRGVGDVYAVVQKALAGGPKTVREIREFTGLPTHIIDRALRILRWKEKVRLVVFADGKVRWSTFKAPALEERAEILKELLADNPLTQGEIKWATGWCSKSIDNVRGQLAVHEGLCALPKPDRSEEIDSQLYKEWGSAWYYPEDGEIGSDPVYALQVSRSKSDVKPVGRRARYVSTTKHRGRRVAARVARGDGGRSQSRRLRHDRTDAKQTKPRFHPPTRGESESE